MMEKPSTETAELLDLFNQKISEDAARQLLNEGMDVEYFQDEDIRKPEDVSEMLASVDKLPGLKTGDKQKVTRALKRKFEVLLSTTVSQTSAQAGNASLPMGLAPQVAGISNPAGGPSCLPPGVPPQFFSPLQPSHAQQTDALRATASFSASATQPTTNVDQLQPTATTGRLLPPAADGATAEDPAVAAVQWLQESTQKEQQHMDKCMELVNKDKSGKLSEVYWIEATGTKPFMPLHCIANVQV
jgi:hypothetical protein